MFAPDLTIPYRQAAEDLRDNDEQWQVYESAGHCVVLAGPGSGKTKTLTVKLAKLLTEEVEPPQGVACITYNTECVRELEGRLEALGIRAGSRLFVGTVHSFCLQCILRPFARVANAALPDVLEIANKTEQHKALHQALSTTVSSAEKPTEWLSRVSAYRRRHIKSSSQEFSRDDAQLSRVILTYTQNLRALGLLDFDDLIIEGFRLLRDNRFVRDCVLSKYPVLAVDEYQDLGRPLHEIVMELFNSGIRILAVGDPDQSIYGFNGAEPKLLRDLSQLDGVEPLTLKFNYRNGGTILNASLAALGEQRPYQSKADHKGLLYFHEVKDGPQAQGDFIVDKIIRPYLAISTTNKPGNIAVLYPDKYDGNQIAAACAQAKIPFARIDRNSIYAKTPFSRFIEDCALWCAEGWYTGSPKFSALGTAWCRFNRSLYSPAFGQTLRLELADFLSQHRHQTNISALDWLSQFDAIIRPVLNRERQLHDQISVWDSMLSATGASGELAAFSLSDLAKTSKSKDRVNLITLHSAKGLEFDIVVMMGMDEGRVPRWDAKTATALAEARRLFYVGLTRAKHEVHFVYSCFTIDKFGRKHPDGRSRFINEVAKQLTG